MKTTIDKLRELARGAMAEAKIGAGASYMRKERIREAVQAAIASMIASGEVKDEEDLAGVMAGAEAAVKALQMVPFSVWQKLSKKA